MNPKRDPPSVSNSRNGPHFDGPKPVLVQKIAQRVEMAVMLPQSSNQPGPGLFQSGYIGPSMCGLRYGALLLLHVSTIKIKDVSDGHKALDGDCIMVVSKSFYGIHVLWGIMTTPRFGAHA